MRAPPGAPRAARGAAAPVLIDPAFDDADAAVALCRASAPYRLAAAVHDSPANGADLPWFRTYWARGGGLLDPAAAAMLHNARFTDAARAAFDARVVLPSSLMINLNAPMAGGEAHIDLPRFRGCDGFPLDLVMAMHRSGLFSDWAVRTASTISWFYRGAHGAFDYWPDGPEHSRRTLETPLWNLALLADNEAMVHRMGAVGPAAARMAPGAISRAARLHADGDGRGWTLADGDDRRRFAEDEVRISILWKALLFDTERDLARFRDGGDDLTPPTALAILDDDLARRGLPRLDPDAGYADEARMRLHAAYPPPAVNQTDPPKAV